MAGESTFCFVDMAGYTALTEAHGDSEAAELATRFAELAAGSLGARDRLVKTLGDAVLVACADPAAALAFLTELFRRADREPDFPLLRAGLHHGPAVEKDGDVFGAAVNLTARIAGLARGGEVFATAEVAEAARGGGMKVVDLGAYELKNVREPVAVYALGTSEVSRGGAVDPVCRVRVSRQTAVGRLRHESVEYWFCSLKCAREFAGEPDRYARKA